MGIQPDSILGVAVSTVTDTMTRMQALGAQYDAKLSGALAQISNITIPEVPVPLRLTVPQATPPSTAIGAPPTLAPPTLKIPNLGVLNIDALLTGLDLGDLEVPEAPEYPVIQMPEAPTVTQIAPPTRPDVDTDIELPEAPDIEQPEMEALEEPDLQLPEFVFPELPEFDAEAPGVSELTVPDVFINWAEPQYQSELLPELLDKVREWMAGGTGLPAPVEDALFSRARERASAETERAVQEAVDTWASRGFTMPPGMLAKAAEVARENGRLRAAELNRDILIEATKWEIENIRFAVQQGMALEQLTLNAYENMAKRLFEVAKFQAEAQITVFNAQVNLFNAQNAAFQTLAQVYRTRLDGAVARLTAYKTAVEARSAVAQVDLQTNAQRIEIYKARLGAVQSNVEVYKAMMQGASVRADVIKNQFDAYRADVQAFAEQVGAEKLKFDAYDSQVKGEAAKAGVVDALARAYASTVSAVSNRADLQVKGAQLKLDAARTKVTKFLADVDAYKAVLQANLGEVQYVTSAFGAQVDAWRAGAQAQAAEAEVQSRFADMNTRTNVAMAEMQMKEYESLRNNAIQQAGLFLEAAKAMGQFTAQLAAGAMSAQHVSAQIGGTGTATTTESFQKSESHQYTYGG